MKIKLLIISFSILASQVFAKEECKGTDVSKWDNCIGNESTLDGSADLGQYETSKTDNAQY